MPDIPEDAAEIVAELEAEEVDVEAVDEAEVNSVAVAGEDPPRSPGAEDSVAVAEAAEDRDRIKNFQ